MKNLMFLVYTRIYGHIEKSYRPQTVHTLHIFSLKHLISMNVKALHDTIEHEVILTRKENVSSSEYSEHFSRKYNVYNCVQICKI